MKQLAEFFVRGALQAAIVVALLEASFLLAWFGAAITALWILRFGINTALPIFIAGLLGATSWAVQGELGPIGNLLATTVLAVVLRSSRSWSMTLFLMPLALGGFYAALTMLSPSYVEGLHQLLTQMFEQFRQNFVSQLELGNAPQEQIDQVAAWPVPGRWAMLGWFATVQATLTILSLLIARWWQALLYNPGGFSSEMGSLRFYPGHALGLLSAAMIAVWGFDGSWWSLSWLGLCILPLGFVGVVLAHSMLNRRRAAVFWKVLFYGILIVWFPLSVVVLAMLAVIDAFVGLRSRSASG